MSDLYRSEGLTSGHPFLKEGAQALLVEDAAECPRWSTNGGNLPPGQSIEERVSHASSRKSFRISKATCASHRKPCLTIFHLKHAIGQ